MKKIGVILSLAILMTLMSFSMCFASGLQLLDSYPKDGSGEARPENFLVKLYFNENVSAKEVQKSNENAFKFTDPKGKELPIRVLYNSKKQNEIWVLVEKVLKSNTSYELHISGDLTIANGDTLGQDKTIKLKIRNTNTDNNVSMGIMGLMMVGMVFFTSISTKRALKKHDEEVKTEERAKVNPYKVSKETGKSVEDIVAKTEKDREKAKAQAEKKNKGKSLNNMATSDSISDQEKDTKRVTGARPISVTGSRYITGRKEKAEKEKQKAAAKAASGTTRPKNSTGKSNNNKKSR